MSEPSPLIVLSRRRGRPRAAEPGKSVKTWLRDSEYDRLIRVAEHHETTVSDLVRRVLLKRLPRA